MQQYTQSYRTSLAMRLLKASLWFKKHPETSCVLVHFHGQAKKPFYLVGWSVHAIFTIKEKPEGPVDVGVSELPLFQRRKIVNLSIKYCSLTIFQF